MESYAAASQVYAAGLIFARVGAIVMLLPGIGDNSVPPRIRLSFAFLMALMLMPLVQFAVIFFLPRWDDEVRGIVFVHAMGLGLLWGLFLAGGLGANLRRPSTNGAAVPAK